MDVYVYIYICVYGYIYICVYMDIYMCIFPPSPPPPR